jgi:hypothetical protein
MRTGKTRADILKQDHLGVYVHLFSLAEAIPSVRQFVGKFDLPFHDRNIVYELCYINGAFLARTCLWRIDTVAVKRSDPRNALRLRTQTPNDAFESLSQGWPDTAARASL